MLILDEPNSEHLDQETEERVLGTLRALAWSGRTVLIAAHHPRVIAAADQVAWLGAEEAAAPAPQAARYEEVPA